MLGLPGKTKIDLWELLLFMRDHQERPVMERIQKRWLVGERAARDAVRVLVKGGWLAEYRLPSDARQKRYRVTTKGDNALRDQRRSWLVLFDARRKHSTTRHTKSASARRRAGARRERAGVTLRRSPEELT